MMNSIDTTKATAKEIHDTLVGEFGWQKLNMSRAEAFGFLKEKQEEADVLGVKLNIVENHSAKVLYIGTAVDSVRNKDSKWFELYDSETHRMTVGFGPAGDHIAVIIQLTEARKPRKPILVTV